MLFVLALSSAIAYTQTTKLDIDAKTPLQLEDLLLLITLPAFLIESMFSLIPAYINSHVFQICIACLRVINVLIQTPLIIDGRRRCSKRKSLHNKKPGRDVVIFLAIANMAMWIYHTFAGGRDFDNEIRYKYSASIFHSQNN